MSKEEKMVDVKCSVCMKDMQMPESFLKAGKKREVDPFWIKKKDERFYGRC